MPTIKLVIKDGKIISAKGRRYGKISADGKKYMDHVWIVESTANIVYTGLCGETFVRGGKVTCSMHDGGGKIDDLTGHTSTFFLYDGVITLKESELGCYASCRPSKLQVYEHRYGTTVVHADPNRYYNCSPEKFLLRFNEEERESTIVRHIAETDGKVDSNGNVTDATWAMINLYDVSHHSCGQVVYAQINDIDKLERLTFSRRLVREIHLNRLEDRLGFSLGWIVSRIPGTYRYDDRKKWQAERCEQRKAFAKF